MTQQNLEKTGSKYIKYHLQINDWLISPIANSVLGVSSLITFSITSRILGPELRGVLAEVLLWPSHIITNRTLHY